MNTNQRVARELLVLAKELLAIDFPTKDAMDKYMKDHPDADRSNHKVVKTDDEESKSDYKRVIPRKPGESEEDAKKRDTEEEREWMTRMGPPDLTPRQIRKRNVKDRSRR